MKKVSLLTTIVSSLFATALHAEEQIDFKNQSWYNSKEITSVISAAKNYNDNCSFENEMTSACKNLGNKIADQFNNPLLDENAVEYVVLKVHPNYQKYSNIEYSYFNGFRQTVSEFAIKGKTSYIEKLLRTSQLAKKGRGEEAITFKKDFSESNKLHEDYVYSVCAIRAVHFNYGSGLENEVRGCISDYNLQYLSALQNSAITLEAVSEYE